MPSFTLVTFNTHYGLRTPRSRCAPYDLAATLDRMGMPEVMVIQEMWRPDGERGSVDEWAQRNGYELFGVTLGRSTLRGRWPHYHVDGEGTVLLAVLSRIPARVMATPSVGPLIGDPSPQRRVLHTEVTVGDRAVQLVGVHLTSRLPHGPPIQLRRLSRVLPNSNQPAVVAGDCNFWGPPVCALLPGWTRAVKGRTWPASRPHSQIDHVLVRGPIDVETADILGDVGSDHRPVRVRLRVR